jgi:hypothetical protein
LRGKWELQHVVQGSHFPERAENANKERWIDKTSPIHLPSTYGGNSCGPATRMNLESAIQTTDFTDYE